VKGIALLGACLFLWVGLDALADVNISPSGRLTFVPAAQRAGDQQYTLTVRGLSRGEPGEAPAEVACLPDAVFGIYAMDAQGIMAPWPDPQAPQRAYQVRSGSAPVRFALSGEIAFFMKQEQAPRGYLPSPEGYWPIGEERDLVFENAMPGGLVVAVRDMDGAPLAGAQLWLTLPGQAEPVARGQSGQDGLWRVDALPAGDYLLRDVPPAGYLPAREAQVTLAVNRAAWAQAIFEHGEPGTLTLRVRALSLDEAGQTVLAPLPGVTARVTDAAGRPAISLLDGQTVALTTDSNGWAQAALSAGEYTLQVDAASAPDLLPGETHHTFAVADGQATPITVDFADRRGRARLRVYGFAGEDAAQAPLPGVAITLSKDERDFGPYLTDAGGAALTEPLEAGHYTLRAENLPAGYELPRALWVGDAQQPWQQARLTIAPAALLDVQLACPSVVTGAYTLALGALGEDGDITPQPVGTVSLAVLHPDGAPVWDAQGEPLTLQTEQDGSFSLTLPAGEYAVLALDVPGALPDAPVTIFLPPDQDGAVLLPVPQARLGLRAVDADGARLGEALYRISGASGASLDVACDGTGRAVSPLLAPGAYQVTSLQNPAGYADAPAVSVTLAAGRFTWQDMPHPQWGQLDIAVLGRALDAQGQAQDVPLADVAVALLALPDGADARNTAAYLPFGGALRTDARGVASCRLPAGTYLPVVAPDAWPAGFAAGEAPTPVIVADGAQTAASVVGADTRGGFRLALRDATDQAQPLTGAAFRLVGSDGSGIDETLAPDARGEFARLGLPRGTYTLRQLRAPEGYDPLPDQTLAVEGGALLTGTLVNARRGTLSVDKRGYTFNAQLQTFRVALQGRYGLYTALGDAYAPYPSEQDQYVLAANMAADRGRVLSVALPASPDGATYYLREMPGSASQGYVDDQQYHPVQVYPGQHTLAEVAATADKGFFTLTLAEAGTGAPLDGGRFALYAAAGGMDGAPVWEKDPALTFTVSGGSYQNEMALPVGSYRVVMTEAPQGYMLDATLFPVEARVDIPAYVTHGNPVAQVAMQSAARPKPNQVRAALGVGQPIPAQGARLLPVATGLENASATPLLGLTLEISLPDDADAHIAGLSLGRARDGQGTPVAAQVFYKLAQGGWRWDDPRLAQGLDQGEAQISLADVSQRVTAVRVRYMDDSLNAGPVGLGFAAGAAQVGAGFTADGCAVLVQGPAGGRLSLALAYRYQYADESGHTVLTDEARRVADGTFLADAASPLPAFKQADASGAVLGGLWGEQGMPNGYWDGQESPRLSVPPVNVRLLDESGAVVAEQTSGRDGTFLFADVPLGTYRLRFLPLEAGYMPAPAVADALGGSAVTDAAAGTTDLFALTPGQRQHMAWVGLMRAAQAQGSVRLEGDVQAGLADVAVTLWRIDTQAAPQPVAEARTDAQGAYSFGGLAPGSYRVRYTLPQGALFARGTSLALDETGSAGESDAFTVGAGDAQTLPPVAAVLTAGVSGTVWLDADFDGLRSPAEAVMPGVQVALLGADAALPLQQTVTDAQGGYAFAGLYPGDYRVRFTLADSYVFTRSPTNGAGSAVRGASGGVGDTPVLSLAMGRAVTGVDVGCTLPASVRIITWQDAHYQGERPANARGVAGVRVALVRTDAADENVEATTWRTTDVDGTLSLDQLPPGAYRLRYELPDGWLPTRGGLLPQDGQSQGLSDAFRLNMGEKDYPVDIGLYLPGTVRGTAWQDANGNGLLDVGEAGLPGVTVRLLQGETVATQTQTGADGVYSLEGLPPGNYTLQAVLPQGHVFSGTARAAERGAPPRADTDTGASQAPFALAMGETLDHMDIGAVAVGSVSGLLWTDGDASGDRQPGEEALAQAAVRLYTVVGDSERPVSETWTDAGGAFIFTGLRPGSYALAVTLPAGFVPTRAGRHGDSPVSFLPGEADEVHSEVFALAMGQDVAGVALGALRLGTVAGEAWDDADFDGLRGEAERPLRGVAVTLLREGEDEPVASLLTGRQGAYRFDGLQPGNYTVRFDLPEGYRFTQEDGDSAVPFAPGRQAETQPFYLGMGETVADVNVGALLPASLSGTAWLDTNNNGLFDAGESPLPGVRVGVAPEDAEDEPLADALTDERGAWRVGDIMPGLYVLNVQLPDGCVFVRDARGSARGSVLTDVDDSWAIGQPMALGAGQRVTEMYIGGVSTARVTGSVWADADDDGVRGAGDGPLPGAVISLAREGEIVAQTQTGVDGSYALEGLRPGAYRITCTLPEGSIFARPPQGSAGTLMAGTDARAGQGEAFTLTGGQSLAGQDIGAVAEAAINGVCWVDALQTGAWDAGQPGLPGALVELLDEATGEVRASVQTLADGAFRFGALRAGIYALRYTLPEGYLFAKGAPLAALNAEETQGALASVVLAAGQAQQTSAVGVVRGASVRGTAWEDSDADGALGASEPPLPGALVTLLLDAGQGPAPYRETQADEAGVYAFDALRPGVYAVRFALPGTYLFTLPSADANARSSAVPAQAGQVGDTPPFALTMGENLRNMNAGGILAGMLGDTAWVDENANGLQDYGEPPLPNVRVVLFALGEGGSREMAGEAVTDQYGLYRFDGLRPGRYVVRAELPPGYRLTTRRDDLPEIDSNFSQSDGSAGESEIVVIGSGEARRDIDIGAQRIP
jgi:protocatechuate 3,4-dioxygenase beta subunit